VGISQTFSQTKYGCLEKGSVSYGLLKGLIIAYKHVKIIYFLFSQLVEQLTFNQWVAGSNPARLTTEINDLTAIWKIQIFPG
jgi:hypothetical protein